jgi:hypothetical protein
LDAVKRLADLTAEDLVASPVWRYEGGSGAEALVVSVKRKSLSQSDDEIFLAATEFELFDGSRHAGFCFPADDSGIDYLQPVIITSSRHVSFWFDPPVTSEVLELQWRALGKGPDDIFPVTFRCLVPVDGRTVNGQIDGVEPSQPATPEPPAASSGIAIERGAPEPREPPAESPLGADPILTARPVGVRQKGAGANTRTARRRKAEWTVEFTQGPFRGTGITGDVSPRGMFVRSNQIPGTGPMVKLTVNLPEGRKLVLTGKVVRSAEPSSPSTAASGFGLRLADELPDYDEILSRLRDKKPK